MQLFREEALQAQTAQYLGTIRIGQPPSFAVVTTAAVLLGAALIAFAVWGEVTRKARVPGILVPLHGTLQITSPQAGVVTERRVNEGDAVSAGQVLIVIGLDRDAGQGQTGALVAQALLARRTTLETELRLAQQQARQRHEALAERLRSIESERRQAEGELEAAQRRVALTAKSLERFQHLVKEGFVSELQLQAKQEEWLDASSRERSAQRSLTALTRDVQAVHAEQANNATQLQTQRAQIERGLATLEQEDRENDARRQVVVAAPQAGIVSGLTVHAGHAVAAGQTLAAVVPQDKASGGQATLEAQLYAPSRTGERYGNGYWSRCWQSPAGRFLARVRTRPAR